MKVHGCCVVFVNCMKDKCWFVVGERERMTFSPSLEALPISTTLIFSSFHHYTNLDAFLFISHFTFRYLMFSLSPSFFWVILWLLFWFQFCLIDSENKTKQNKTKFKKNLKHRVSRIYSYWYSLIVSLPILLLLGILYLSTYLSFSGFFV